MNKQNIQEELEKFKLYSNYKSSKTLTENVDVIFEQPTAPANSPQNFPTISNQLKNVYTGLKLPDGVSLEAYQKIMSVSAQNKKRLQGSYLAPAQQREIDKEFGAGTYKKFWDGGGRDVLEGKKSFNLPASDEPTGDMAKVKDLETVVVTGRKNKNVVNPKNTPKVNFNPNDEFPLKFLDKGDKIKQLQTALGLKNNKGQSLATGNFHTATENAIKAKSAELGLNYDRKTGVDENMFDKIMGRTTGTTQTIDIERKRPDISTGVPKTLPTQAPTIQTPTTELSLEQQFQMAKINLDKAKKELDAAQATNDRAKIGAARGKQQAARAEVQRLRNELYPPQQ